MNAYYETLLTPLGPFSIAVNEGGAVIATAFGNRDMLQQRLGRTICHLMDDKSRVAQAREQVLAYFAGERRSFDLPLAAHGTDFQRRVWAALQAIPFGQTRTYGEIATALEQPSAARAVGRANANNPICVIVPCHRVIGADGALTGFAFGEDLKRRLLAHEHAPACRAA